MNYKLFVQDDVARQSFLLLHVHVSHRSRKKILWYLKLLLLAILNDPTIKGYFYFFKSFPFDQPNPFFVIKRASLKRG